ncbi:MAG TPA: hypothetical protein VFQ45_21505 [Longimicrobium sp.]|nr:hypothetical protein [Longimicrobium sp.]
MRWNRALVTLPAVVAAVVGCSTDAPTGLTAPGHLGQNGVGFGSGNIAGASAEVVEAEAAAAPDSMMAELAAGERSGVGFGSGN